MPSSIHASLKWQDGRTPVSKWTGLCIFSLYLEFTALQWMPVLLLTHVSTSTLLGACLWYEHHYGFCVFGVASQMKSVLLKQLSPYELYTLGVACWEVTWPNDLQTRFCQYTGIPLADHTGRPLEPQVHWDATGTTLAHASTKWCSSGDPVLICIIGTHWRTTGAASTLGYHWNHTGWC